MVFQVGVAAYGGEPPASVIDVVRKVLKILASNIRGDLALILGGDWGFMGVVVEEAINLDVPVVCILPEGRIGRFRGGRVIYVKSRSSPNLRSSILVSSSDVLLVAGGGAGCMMESLMAYREGVPVVAISGYGLDTDRFFECFRGPFDSRNLGRVYIVDSPSKAASKILEVYKEWASNI